MNSKMEPIIREDPLLRTAREAAGDVGVPAFLVGGAVRDLLLGRAPSDLDLACARAEEVAGRAAARLGTRVVSMGRGRFRSWRVPAGSRCRKDEGKDQGEAEGETCFHRRAPFRISEKTA